MHAPIPIPALPLEESISTSSSCPITVTHNDFLLPSSFLPSFQMTASPIAWRKREAGRGEKKVVTTTVVKEVASASEAKGEAQLACILLGKG